jgi:3-oxoacyl-[acyl-carrier protein] reductase
MTQQSGMLDGKRVLIVGGGGDGIGRAITRAAAAAGAGAIAIVGSNRERTETASQEIAGPDCRSVPIVDDVRSDGAAERALGEMVHRLGGIDILITVIGGSSAWAPKAPVHETTLDHWNLLFDMNLGYVFRFVRAALPYFLEQRTGAIVSVGSITGVRSGPNACAYGAAKAGLMSLARTVGAEYADRGIRMNVINAGMTVTPKLIAGTGSSAPYVSAIPMGRGATPKEIADMVTFFASPLSAYVTGQAVNVDGGAMVTFPFNVRPKEQTA